MKLDSRIIEGKRPLSCFDTVEADKFIGEQGYFSDNIEAFSNMSNLTKDVLKTVSLSENDQMPYRTKITSWKYFLPEQWAKKTEKKYRPYSLEEFLAIFNIGDLMVFKGKGCCDEVKVAMFSGYITDVERIDDKTPGACEIMLGCFHYSLFSLFEDFERFYNGEWQPFGVIDE